MRKFTKLALLAAVVVPIWKIHTLNASVDHLRKTHEAVPFFAFYRYGFQTGSVVFNVNAQQCSDVVDNVIPAFHAFLAVMQAENPREVRLAWQGETVAVVQRAAMETIWRSNSWRASYTLDPLAQAVVCTQDGDLLIDWELLMSEKSVLI